MSVVAALHAVLRWHGGLVGSCTTWWGLGMCWVGVAGLARHVGMACQWQLGLACHIEVAWRVGGVLRVMLRRHGGSVGSWRAVLGWQWQRGRAGWRWHTCTNGLQSPGSCMLCWGGEVGWRWQGVEAGWRWLACMNGLQHPGLAVAACCKPCQGGVLGWGPMVAARVYEGTAMACNIEVTHPKDILFMILPVQGIVVAATDSVGCCVGNSGGQGGGDSWGSSRKGACHGWAGG
ncbi:hypothetical protein EDB83DRAFT_2553111 [Lactarius deliciosus]|nr:hypothetical protein EDB83DRAFT_2553111 [Lactarius deliciosus]